MGKEGKSLVGPPHESKFVYYEKPDSHEFHYGTIEAAHFWLQAGYFSSQMRFVVGKDVDVIQGKWKFQTLDDLIKRNGRSMPFLMCDKENMRGAVEELNVLSEELIDLNKRRLDVQASMQSLQDRLAAAQAELALIDEKVSREVADVTPLVAPKPAVDPLDAPSLGFDPFAMLKSCEGDRRKLGGDVVICCRELRDRFYRCNMMKLQTDMRTVFGEHEVKVCDICKEDIKTVCALLVHITSGRHMHAMRGAVCAEAFAFWWNAVEAATIESRKLPPSKEYDPKRLFEAKPESVNLEVIESSPKPKPWFVPKPEPAIAQKPVQQPNVTQKQPAQLKKLAPSAQLLPSPLPALSRSIANLANVERAPAQKHGKTRYYGQQWKHTEKTTPKPTVVKTPRRRKNKKQLMSYEEFTEKYNVSELCDTKKPDQKTHFTTYTNPRFADLCPSESVVKSEYSEECDKKRLDNDQNTVELFEKVAYPHFSSLSSGIDLFDMTELCDRNEKKLDNDQNTVDLFEKVAYPHFSITSCIDPFNMPELCDDDTEIEDPKVPDSNTLDFNQNSMESVEKVSYPHFCLSSEIDPLDVPELCAKDNFRKSKESTESVKEHGIPKECDEKKLENDQKTMEFFDTNVKGSCPTSSNRSAEQALNLVNCDGWRVGDRCVWIKQLATVRWIGRLADRKKNQNTYAELEFDKPLKSGIYLRADAFLSKPPSQTGFVLLSQIKWTKTVSLSEYNGWNAGNRCVWENDGVVKNMGTVRWIGRLKGHTSVYAGVAFDKPIGGGTGMYQGNELFRTRNNHAGFVRLSTLVKIERLESSV